MIARLVLDGVADPRMAAFSLDRFMTARAAE
jgi:hypothetical protein